MHFKTESKKEIFNDGINTGYELAELNKYTIVELEIPGRLEPHEVPFEMIFYVIEGSGTYTIKDKEIIADKGDVLTVEPGSKRGWENNKSTTLRLLALRGNKT